MHSFTAIGTTRITAMDNWEKIFLGVQSIAQTARSFDEGLQLTIELARSDKIIFDNSEYWNRVENHIAQIPSNTIIEWAREGLERHNPIESWDVFITDLGDCPEIFYIYKLGCQSSLSEEKFRKLVFSKSIVSFDDFTTCFITNETEAEQTLYNCKDVEFSYHNVRELRNDILTWNVDSVDFNGNNGYLLWLALGSLALLEPLRNTEYCNGILHGRGSLYLLSGFEEIFLYLATVTPEGLLFEW